MQLHAVLKVGSSVSYGFPLDMHVLLDMNTICIVHQHLNTVVLG